MARLFYVTPPSLDGYIADETGNPEIYETLAVWETPEVIPGRTPRCRAQA